MEESKRIFQKKSLKFLFLLFSPLSPHLIVLEIVCSWMDFEAVETGHELRCGLFGAELGVDEEEHVREARPEVGAVRVLVTRRAGHVDVATPRTVQLHHRLARHVRETWKMSLLCVSIKCKRQFAC